MHLSPAPLFPVAVGFAVGITAVACGVGLWGILIFSATILCGILAHRPRVTVGGAGFGAGMIVALFGLPHEPGIITDSASHQFSGTVRELREVDGARSVVVSIDSCDGQPCRPFKASLYIPSLIPEISETDRMRFTARLHPLVSTTDLPDETDYTVFRRKAGIVAEGVTDPDDISVTGPEEGLLNNIRRVRLSAVRSVVLTPFDPQTAAFLVAVLTGDRSMTDPEVKDTFSASGLAHLLALSGLHVGILTGCFSLFLIPMLLCGHRKLSMALTIGALWFFAIMTGLSPSVVRAVIMGSILLLSFMLERRTSPLNALSLAAILILLFDPGAILMPGFQLSFIGVLSILVFAPILTPRRDRHPFVRTLGAFAAVSVAATIGTGVWSASLFGYFPLWFLPANIIASFIMPPLLSCGAVATLLHSTGVPAAWLCAVADRLYSLLVGVATALSDLPSVAVHNIPATLILSYYFIIVLTALWTVHRKPYLLTGAITATVITTGWLSMRSTEAYPHSELFIPRSKHETTILLRLNHNMQAYTTSPVAHHNDLRHRFEHRYAGYLAMRGVDSIHIIPISTGSTVNFGRQYLTIINGTTSTTPCTGGYLLVCKGFRGSIVDLVADCMPDTVLISSDVHPRVATRWQSDLEQMAIPVRNMRDEPFALR